MASKTVDDILEHWKQWGLYGLQLHYGEGVGCDDSDVPAEERRVRMIGTPVGCLGEARVLWCGSLAMLRDFEPRGVRPEQLPNPPGERARGEGWFVWGAEERSVESALEFLYRAE